MFTKDEIKSKVSTDPRWTEHAVLAIFDRQTQDEQDTESTSHKNSVGFSAFDAEIMSSFAKQLRNGRHLSEKQLVVAFKRMPRYSGQLAEIAASH